jgi:hypothetical protein
MENIWILFCCPSWAFCCQTDSLFELILTSAALVILHCENLEIVLSFLPLWTSCFIYSSLIRTKSCAEIIFTYMAFSIILLEIVLLQHLNLGWQRDEMFRCSVEPTPTSFNYSKVCSSIGVTSNSCHHPMMNCLLHIQLHSLSLPIHMT